MKETNVKHRTSLGAKALNLALLVSFVLTILVPITGVHIHKLASVAFLLLSAVHTVNYRNGMTAKRALLLALIVLSFLTGLLGMILDQYPLILQLHKVISIAVTAFLAIHIFVFHRKLCSKA